MTKEKKKKQVFSIFVFNANEHKRRKQSLLTCCWSSLRARSSALTDSSSPLLVSLTCWHLLGASLSHWSGSSHSERTASPRASWRELAVGASAGMRRRRPRPPQIYNLFIFSLKWCHSPEEGRCHRQGDRVLFSDAAELHKAKFRGQWWPHPSTMGATKKYVESSTFTLVIYRLLVWYQHTVRSLASGSPLSLCCVSQHALPSPLCMGKFQSVSTICSPNPPLPNYNSRRSRTIQHTPQSSAASD